nr:glycosyltransferase [Microbacterium immunditiarum]
MFGDQHLATLGGAQVSMRLQKKFLERAGHTVTVVAPAPHGPARQRIIGGDDALVDLPSIPITPDREYSFSWPGRRTDRFVDAAMEGRPPVDLVHVQGDFWAAFIGHRFAARHGLPVVHTMHNRVDVGVEATTPFPALVLAVLNWWQQRAVAGPLRMPGRDGWTYQRRFAELADAVTVPSSHFARRLEENGVVPGGTRAAKRGVDVVWNGIDDDLLDEVRATAALEREPGLPRFVWLGRMSPEKRLLPFLEAVAESGVAADVTVVGGGAQLRAAQRIVEERRPAASVSFAGRLSYPETLQTIQRADAVVQTSIGFETQGMTIFEAASVGTPSIVSDPDLAHELGSGLWPVAGDADAAAEVSALAEALRRAAADIEAGTAPEPDPDIRERFRQSSRTAAMVEVYDRVRS